MNRISLLSGFLIACVISYASALDSESIVGGVEANKSQFPYQISLQVKERNHCGGAILSDTFILTAAHCVINQTSHAFKDYAYKVVANTLHTKIRPIEVAVDKIYVLRNLKLDYNDIAVLKLEAPLDLKKNKLRAINLPSADKDYAGVKAVISGYGKNEIKIDYENKDYPKEVGSSDGKLRYIAVDILSNTDCQINNHPEDIPETKICGKAVQENETGKHNGICSGDSGGPLVYNNVVIGVVSSSPFGCDESRLAAAYTRVSSFLPFIQDVMDGRLGPEVREHKVVNKPMQKCC